tara:strand:+ start:712 stop:1023 length:312 start_codon:yes stop_codon:yes gene_type:complete
MNLSAKEINWTEVAKTSNEIQFIDTKSIKYNKKGLLSVSTKYSELTSENQKEKNSRSYIMAIDCTNRLFSKLPVNGDLDHVKSWNNPVSNKLIKVTIINTCSY